MVQLGVASDSFLRVDVELRPMTGSRQGCQCATTMQRHAHTHTLRPVHVHTDMPSHTRSECSLQLLHLFLGKSGRSQRHGTGRHCPTHNAPALADCCCCFLVRALLPGCWYYTAGDARHGTVAGPVSASIESLVMAAILVHPGAGRVYCWGQGSNEAWRPGPAE